MSTSKHHSFTSEVGAVVQRSSCKADFFGDSVLHIDLSEFPIDDSLLDWFDVEQLIKLEILPWRKFGNRLVYVTGDTEIVTPPYPFEGVANIDFILADPILIRKFLVAYSSERLLDTARNLCPDKFSYRNFRLNSNHPKFAIGIIFVTTTFAAFPAVWFMGPLIWLIIANIATTVLRFSALLSWRRDADLPFWLPEGTTRILQHRCRLKVSILVPLFRESTILPRLINLLQLLEYPRESFEVKFLLEEVGTQTLTALSNLTLPDFIQFITVPKDWLQTKPKAMNFALPLCDGDIIGIYDAEDRPDPDQI